MCTVRDIVDREYNVWTVWTFGHRVVCVGRAWTGMPYAAVCVSQRMVYVLQKEAWLMV